MITLKPIFFNYKRNSTISMRVSNDCLIFLRHYSITFIDIINKTYYQKLIIRLWDDTNKTDGVSIFIKLHSTLVNNLLVDLYVIVNTDGEITIVFTRSKNNIDV